MAAVSLTLYVIESMIPPPVPIPGVKIGLAYLPISFLIFVGGSWKTLDGAAVLAVRVILSAFVSGSLMSLCFSVCGGLLAVTVMGIMRLLVKEKWAVLPASVFAAAAHNAGQLIAATLFYTPSVWAYYPYLLISAVISGAFSGIIIYILIKKPIRIISKIKNI